GWRRLRKLWELLQRERPPQEDLEAHPALPHPRNDKRFFLKTQKRREVRFLLDNLKTYVEHLRSYPHSLLRYFIVMLSVFYPDDRISAR
ncbi:unnamed protein product, partial [Tetraodon nigroviridis]